MEEDFDYMSDDFINSCASNDLRPGLVHSRVKQREYAEAKKKNQQIEEYKRNNVSSKVLASERLTEGLEQAIGPENKGFSMLQKMGYKPGSSLGSGSGILEPISISIKNDRHGLGRAQALKDIKFKKQQLQGKKKAVLNLIDYRAGLSKKYRERETKSDLFKSAKACHKLDTENNILRPEEPWFWPESSLPQNVDENDDDDDETNEFSAADKLEILTMYLRKGYMYCIWCGVQYDDEKDFSTTCPGTSREDH